MSQDILEKVVKEYPPITLSPPLPKLQEKRRLTLRRAHKWLGITAGLWLTVLGVTGFFLDHRDWRWIWQTTVSDFLFPESILKNKTERELLVYRINPVNVNQRIAGGKRGLWWSDTAGTTWSRSDFKSLDHKTPQVFSVVEMAQQKGFWKLYAATDDGVWFSFNGGKSFHRFALQGEYINALTQGAQPDKLLGVISRSSVFRLDITNGEYVLVELAPVDKKEIPAKIGLSRFVHDLHFGRGLVNGITSLLINDAGGIALLVLPVTGILFWLLPLRWKKRKANSHMAHVVHVGRRRIMRFLYGWHGVYVGLLATVLIVYLAITGIILDHRVGLGDWMKKTKIDRSWLPPVYDLNSWESEIYSVASYPSRPEKFSIGVRSGLYTTMDNGQTWSREKLSGPSACFVWSINRVGDFLFLGGMGCPNSIKKDGESWQLVKGVGHMPTDAFGLAGGNVAWKSPKGLTAILLHDRSAGAIEIKKPKIEGTPLFYLLDGLHSGLIFHPQWKWINDLVSVMAILLCVSGVVRLWRQRRVVSKRFLWNYKGRGRA